MIVLASIKVAATAVAAIITASSLTNMSQTFSVSRQQPITSANMAMALELKNALTRCSQDESLSMLQGLTRKDLLYLYRVCAAPSSTDAYAGKEWNGLLLNNNSVVMTQITAYITNKLFGKGSRWRGKSFDTKGCCGSNQFIQPTTGSVETMHTFEYESDGVSAIDGNQSVKLRYSSHHPFLSPWHTMVDELRVLREPDKNGKDAIMLGLGYMAWSGGSLNSSPFCLAAVPSERRR